MFVNNFNFYLIWRPIKKMNVFKLMNIGSGKNIGNNKLYEIKKKMYL